MKEWKEERCASQPDELQIIASGVYMQRRNITEVEHEATEDTPAYTDYSCECREITVSEYEMLQSIADISTDKAVEAYTLELMEEGSL